MDKVERLVDLEYPGTDGNPTHLHINLLHVRAADGIRVSYDFKRDGWVIEQAKYFSWLPGAECDPGWAEVAFVQAWAREEDHPSVMEAPDAS